MAAWLGPLIGAAGSLLGGLFGNKEQKTTSTIDYDALRRNAEKAGFNPLTALRAGGGAGFTTTTHPALSSASFIADAFNGIGNAVSAIDPMRDATAKLEYQIQQETLKSLQRENALRTRASLGGVPVATGARNKTTATIPTLYSPWLNNGPGGNNEVIYLPNADLPEMEQMPIPALGVGGNYATNGARKAVADSHFKVTPLVPRTGRDRFGPGAPSGNKSWTDYIPSFSFNWR